MIHENRGLNPYIEDVARRLAVAEFLAFAPDALTPLGGYPGDEEKAAQMFGTARPVKRIDDLVAAVGFLQVASRMHRQGRRGRILLRRRRRQQLAVRLPDLGGGRAVLRRPAERRRRRQDQGAAADPLRRPRRARQRRLARLRGGAEGERRKYQAFIYPNTNHGFHNDTTPRYDEAAAKLAWSRTIAFFKETLKS